MIVAPANGPITTPEKLWARGMQLNHTGTFDLGNYEIINFCCFKLLNIGIICYAAMDS